MAKLSPMQIVQELTGQAKAAEAKKAFAKSLSAKKIGEGEDLKTLSNSKLLRLARRHAPELLGKHAPKPAKAAN